MPAISATLDSASDKEACQKLLRGSLLKLTQSSSDSFFVVPATGNFVVRANGRSPGYQLLVNVKWVTAPRRCPSRS